MAKPTIVGPFQVDYAHLVEAKDYQNNGKFKYSMTVVIPKKDKVAVKKIWDALKQEMTNKGFNAAQQKQALAVAQTMSTENNFSTLRDGDVTNEAREAANESPVVHLANCYTFKASRLKDWDRPQVRKVNPETNKADLKVPVAEMGQIQRGDFIYMAFEPYASDKNGKYRVTTTLQGIVFHRKATEKESFGVSDPFKDEEFEFVPEPAPPELGENPFPDTETDEV